MLLNCAIIAIGCIRIVASDLIALSKNPPAGTSAPLAEAFVSYSIEFAFFPDFAGNDSLPNKFSDNLLNNIGKLTGTKPYVRVGGNTQDFAQFDPNLKTATYGIINPALSPDYPTTLHIGPSYFQSYNSWSDTKFIHGFNLGLEGNSSAGMDNLLQTVPLACSALQDDRLLWWEYGNEPDLYLNTSHISFRPPTWDEPTYVAEWLKGTRSILTQLTESCPGLATDDNYGYIAPSFGGTKNHLQIVPTFHDGLDTDKTIKLISSHNYIAGAEQPGVTLQGTLMNHTKTVESVSFHLSEMDALADYSIPYILGEANSLFNQGAPGLSNSFGAALWGVDFNLWCASQGIYRVHMHQGTDYRYQAWQPIETSSTTMGTKAPYYGNIAVAAIIGNLVKQSVNVVNIPLPYSFAAAYAVYVDSNLARVALINMRQYSYTVDGASSEPNPVPRSSLSYSFEVPDGFNSLVPVQRLLANGSDAITGITWDGYSYNYELASGNPVKLKNVTTGEVAEIIAGIVNIIVPDSTVAVLNFDLP